MMRRPVRRPVPEWCWLAAAAVLMLATLSLLLIPGGGR